MHARSILLTQINSSFLGGGKGKGCQETRFICGRWECRWILKTVGTYSVSFRPSRRWRCGRSRESWTTPSIFWFRRRLSGRSNCASVAVIWYSRSSSTTFRGKESKDTLDSIKINVHRNVFKSIKMMSDDQFWFIWKHLANFDNFWLTLLTL